MTKHVNSIKTDSQLQRLKCPADKRRIEVADALAPGLRIRVTGNGTKSFVWYTTNPTSRKRRVVNLGQYPGTSLEKARESLKGMKRVRNNTGITPSNDTVLAMACQYLDVDLETVCRDGWTKELKQAACKSQQLAGLRAPEKVVSSIVNHILPAIGHLVARNVEPAHIIAMVRGLKGEPARLAHLYSRTLFGYGVVTQIAERNPASDFNAKQLNIHRTADMSRDRVATREEVTSLLAALDGDGRRDNRTDLAIRICLSLGIRAGELHKAEWSEVLFMRKRWAVPGSHTKSGKPITYPLSEPVLDCLQQLHKITGGGSLVMGGADVRATYRRLTRLQKPNSKGVVLWDTGDVPVTLHDLRRTASTHMHGLKLADSKVIEFQLGHAVGSSVKRTYDKAAHMDAREALLAEWSRRLGDPSRLLLHDDDIQTGEIAAG